MNVGALRLKGKFERDVALGSITVLPAQSAYHQGGAIVALNSCRVEACAHGCGNHLAEWNRRRRELNPRGLEFLEPSVERLARPGIRHNDAEPQFGAEL